MLVGRSLGSYTIFNIRPFKVAVCLITLWSFLFNTILFDTAWADDTPSELSPDGFNAAISPGLVKELHPETFVLPEYLGVVKDSWKAPGGRSTVIHIQDAHCNYACQQKISEIIDHLNKTYGLDTVNLEGGAEDYDLSVFTDMQDRSERSGVTDYFVREGMLSGAESFAINNPDVVSLWGVEDKTLYLGNLEVYREYMKHKPGIDKHLKALGLIMNGLKAKVYSKELFDLDMKYSSYKAGNMEFRGYIGYLMESAARNSVDVKEFKNIDLLNRTLEAEKSIDFKAADRQRDELVDRLHKRLAKVFIGALVSKAVAFRAGKLSQKDFYEYLLMKADTVGVQTKDLPEFEKYLKYILLYGEVDKSAIMDEIRSLEDKIRQALYRNDDEWRLGMLSKNLALLKNIFKTSLTVDDYRYYLANESSFAIRNFTDFIDRMAPIYKIAYRPEPSINELDLRRTELVKFYEYSFKRDLKFIENMKTGKDSSAIFVTGGFHTENLYELFKKNGISYISIMPNFTNGDGYVCPYYDLLAGKPNPVAANIKTVLGFNLAVASMLTKLGYDVYGRDHDLFLRAYAEWVRASRLAPPQGIRKGDRAVDPSGNFVSIDNPERFVSLDNLPAPAAAPAQSVTDELMAPEPYKTPIAETGVSYGALRSATFSKTIRLAAGLLFLTTLTAYGAETLPSLGHAAIVILGLTVLSGMGALFVYIVAKFSRLAFYAAISLHDSLARRIAMRAVDILANNITIGFVRDRLKNYVRMSAIEIALQRGTNDKGAAGEDLIDLAGEDPLILIAALKNTDESEFSRHIDPLKRSSRLIDALTEILQWKKARRASLDPFVDPVISLLSRRYMYGLSQVFAVFGESALPGLTSRLSRLDGSGDRAVNQRGNVIDMIRASAAGADTIRPDIASSVATTLGAVLSTGKASASRTVLALAELVKRAPGSSLDPAVSPLFNAMERPLAKGEDISIYVDVLAAIGGRKVAGLARGILDNGSLNLTPSNRARINRLIAVSLSGAGDEDIRLAFKTILPETEDPAGFSNDAAIFEEVCKGIDAIAERLNSAEAARAVRYMDRALAEPKALRYKDSFQKRSVFALIAGNILKLSPVVQDSPLIYQVMDHLASCIYYRKGSDLTAYPELARAAVSLASQQLKLDPAYDYPAFFKRISDSLYDKGSYEDEETLAEVTDALVSMAKTDNNTKASDIMISNALALCASSAHTGSPLGDRIDAAIRRAIALALAISPDSLAVLIGAMRGRLLEGKGPKREVVDRAYDLIDVAGLSESQKAELAKLWCEVISRNRGDNEIEARLGSLGPAAIEAIVGVLGLQHVEDGKKRLTRLLADIVPGSADRLMAAIAGINTEETTLSSIRAIYGVCDALCMNAERGAENALPIADRRRILETVFGAWVEVKAGLYRSGTATPLSSPLHKLIAVSGYDVAAYLVQKWNEITGDDEKASSRRSSIGSALAEFITEKGSADPASVPILLELLIVNHAHHGNRVVYVDALSRIGPESFPLLSAALREGMAKDKGLYQSTPSEYIAIVMSNVFGRLTPEEKAREVPVLVAALAEVRQETQYWAEKGRDAILECLKTARPQAAEELVRKFRETVDLYKSISKDSGAVVTLEMEKRGISLAMLLSGLEAVGGLSRVVKEFLVDPLIDDQTKIRALLQLKGNNPAEDVLTSEGLVYLYAEGTFPDVIRTQLPQSIGIISSPEQLAGLAVRKDAGDYVRSAGVVGLAKTVKESGDKGKAAIAAIERIIPDLLAIVKDGNNENLKSDALSALISAVDHGSVASISALESIIRYPKDAAPSAFKKEAILALMNACRSLAGNDKAAEDALRRLVPNIINMIKAHQPDEFANAKDGDEYLTILYETVVKVGSDKERAGAGIALASKHSRLAGFRRSLSEGFLRTTVKSDKEINNLVGLLLNDAAGVTAIEGLDEIIAERYARASRGGSSYFSEVIKAEKSGTIYIRTDAADLKDYQSYFDHFSIILFRQFKKVPAEKRAQFAEATKRSTGKILAGRSYGEVRQGLLDAGAADVEAYVFDLLMLTSPNYSSFIDVKRLRQLFIRAIQKEDAWQAQVRAFVSGMDRSLAHPGTIVTDTSVRMVARFPTMGLGIKEGSALSTEKIESLLADLELPQAEVDVWQALMPEDGESRDEYLSRLRARKDGKPSPFLSWLAAQHGVKESVAEIRELLHSPDLADKKKGLDLLQALLTDRFKDTLRPLTKDAKGARFFSEAAQLLSVVENRVTTPSAQIAVMFRKAVKTALGRTFKKDAKTKNYDDLLDPAHPEYEKARQEIEEEMRLLIAGLALATDVPGAQTRWAEVKKALMDSAEATAELGKLFDKVLSSTPMPIADSSYKDSTGVNNEEWIARLAKLQAEDGMSDARLEEALITIMKGEAIEESDEKATKRWLKIASALKVLHEEFAKLGETPTDAELLAAIKAAFREDDKKVLKRLDAIKNAYGLIRAADRVSAILTRLAGETQLPSTAASELGVLTELQRGLFREEVQETEGDLQLFTDKIVGSEDLVLELMKTPWQAVFGGTADICIAGDTNLIDSETFMPIALKSGDRYVGYVLLHVIQKNGKRFLLVAGIEPSTDYLLSHNARDIVNASIEFVKELAVLSGASEIGISSAGGSISNRNSVATEITSRGYPGDSLGFAHKIGGNYTANNYYTIWSGERSLTTDADIAKVKEVTPPQLQDILDLGLLRELNVRAVENVKDRLANNGENSAYLQTAHKKVYDSIFRATKDKDRSRDMARSVTTHIANTIFRFGRPLNKMVFDFKDEGIPQPVVIDYAEGIDVSGVKAGAEPLMLGAGNIALAPAVAHFEALRLPGDRNALTKDQAIAMRDARLPPSVPIPNVEAGYDLRMDKRELAELGRIFTDQELGAMINAALARLGTDKEKLKGKPILIALLDKDQSQHLFENCTQDGFIGINRDLFAIGERLLVKTSQKNASAITRALITAGLFHELRHEAGIAVDEMNTSDEALLFAHSLGYGVAASSVRSVLSGIFTSENFVKAAVAAMGATIIPKARTYQSPQGSPIPFNLEISPAAFADGLTEETVRRLVNAIARKDMREVSESGRSLIVSLPRKSQLRSGGRTFAAIKIKLVNYRGAPPQNIPYVDQPDEKIAQPTARMAFTADGKMRVDPALSHPAGGGYLFEAVNEYMIMDEAFRAGVPTAYPIGVGELTDMDFNSEAMGFIVMGIENDADRRSGDTVKSYYTEGETAAKARDFSKALKSVKEAYQRLNSAAMSSAATMRRLHSVGITHTHPHYNNFYVGQGGVARVYDLTNGTAIRDMHTREEFILRVFNDFRSFYLNSYVLATEANSVSMEGYLTLLQKLGISESFVDNIYKGYFTKEDIALIGEERLKLAMGSKNMFGFMNRYWMVDRLAGKGLQDFDNDIVRIFEEIAGRIYDRLNSGRSGSAAPSAAMKADLPKNSVFGLADGGARKEIAYTGRGILPEEMDLELLPAVRELAKTRGKIVTSKPVDLQNGGEPVPIKYTKIYYKSNEEIGGIVLVKRGIAGALNITDTDGTVYMLVEEGEDRAIEHEELEIAWREFLGRGPPENLIGENLLTRLSGSGYRSPVDHAAHILAGASQVLRHDWRSMRGSPFLKAQLMGMSKRQLRETIIREDRDVHHELINSLLGAKAEKVLTFEAMVKGYANKLNMAKTVYYLALGGFIISALMVPIFGMPETILDIFSVAAATSSTLFGVWEYQRSRYISMNTAKLVSIGGNIALATATVMNAVKYTASQSILSNTALYLGDIGMLAVVASTMFIVMSRIRGNPADRTFYIAITGPVLALTILSFMTRIPGLAIYGTGGVGSAARILEQIAMARARITESVADVANIAIDHMRKNRKGEALPVPGESPRRIPSGPMAQIPDISMIETKVMSNALLATDVKRPETDTPDLRAFAEFLDKGVLQEYPETARALKGSGGILTEAVFETWIDEAYKNLRVRSPVAYPRSDPDIAEYSRASRGSIKAGHDTKPDVEWHERGPGGWEEVFVDVEKRYDAANHISLMGVVPEKGLIDALDAWITRQSAINGWICYYKVPPSLERWKRRDPVTIYIYVPASVSATGSVSAERFEKMYKDALNDLEMAIRPYTFDSGPPMPVEGTKIVYPNISIAKGYSHADLVDIAEWASSVPASDIDMKYSPAKLKFFAAVDRVFTKWRGDLGRAAMLAFSEREISKYRASVGTVAAILQVGHALDSAWEAYTKTAGIHGPPASASRLPLEFELSGFMQEYLKLQPDISIGRGAEGLREFRRLVDGIVDRVKISGESSPYQVLNEIHHYLHSDYGFEFETGYNILESFASHKLKCNYASLVFYEVGKRLNLPIELRVVYGDPVNHMFVAWRQADGTALYWEPLAKGKSRRTYDDDNDLSRRFGEIHNVKLIDGKSRKVDEKEVLAEEAVRRYLETDDRSEERRLLQAAQLLDPENPSLHIVLGDKAGAIELSRKRGGDKYADYMTAVLGIKGTDQSPATIATGNVAKPDSNLSVSSTRPASSTFGLADGGALAQLVPAELTPAGITIELRDDIPMSDELRDWNIRHEMWHHWASTSSALDGLDIARRGAIEEVAAVILAFGQMREITDPHIQALLMSFGMDPRAPPEDATDNALINGIIAYLSATRPGYAENLKDSRERIIAVINQAVGVIPEEVAVTSAKQNMYDAAKEFVPQIVSMINKNAPTFITAPAPELDISPTTNCDKSAERILNKSGHAVSAHHYKIGVTPQETRDNLLKRIADDDTIGEFYKSVKKELALGARPVSRWIIRVTSRDDKSGIERYIKEELEKIEADKAVIAKILARIHVVVVVVPTAEHLNPVIDLFADIGMMELDRYMQKDYDAGDPMFMRDFRARLAVLLRSSATNLENVDGNSLEDVLKKLFDGSEVLMIKAINWNTVTEWKKSQDAVLQSL